MVPLEYEGSIIVAILEMNKASISQAFYSITFYVVHDKVFTTACDGCSMDVNKVSLIHDLGTKHGCELQLLWVPLQNSGGLHIQLIQNSESIPEKIKLGNLFQSATTTITNYCMP
jgi:hypothetical protein